MDFYQEKGMEKNMALAKTKTVFFCQNCGFESAKWQGRCTSCGEWNTLQEEKISKAKITRTESGFLTLASEEPVDLDQISLEKTTRYQTGIGELDRVLGGGIVPGTLTLFGGDPGIGKSTLVLQLLHHLSLNKISTLYVTGEESKEQIKLRADRLKISSNLKIVAENDLDKILNHVDKLKPQILVIDSIQTVYSPHLETTPGSVSQVRESAGKLLYFSKSSFTSTLLIGHVTKDGSIAGPRVLEHMVDTVLYFEGENTGQFRILRTIKNRYGSTNEIGVFEMTSEGLKQVINPSQIFLREKTSEKIGACITAHLEGTRSLLTEIEALVCSSGLANPRRTSIGVDSNRIALIIAVMEKVLGFKLYDQDVYVSAAGGLKIFEPACDLAILTGIASSFLNRTVSGQLVAMGEIGLSGEIRPVSQIDKRIQEAARLGYKTVMVPKANKTATSKEGLKLLFCSHVLEIKNLLFT